MAATEYATAANMLAAYSDDIRAALKLAADADADDLDENSVFTAAVSDANGLVDSAVRNRYDVADADVLGNELLVGIARQVAFYNILVQFRREALSEADVERFRENRRVLEEIRTGKLSLQYPPKNRESRIIGPSVVKMGENATTNDTSYRTATKSEFMANY